jgi:hypothetical protein
MTERFKVTEKLPGIGQNFYAAERGFYPRPVMGGGRAPRIPCAHAAFRTRYGGRSRAAIQASAR